MPPPDATRQAKLPPTPAMPALLQTANWLFRPLAFMATARQQLGDVFGVRVLGWAKLVLVSDPALIREIFSTDPGDLKAGEANDLMRPVVGAQSVFLLDGAEHRQIRRVLINAFNLENARRAAEFSRTRTMEMIRERCDGRRHDVHRLFGEISLATMLESLFGVSERWVVEDYYRHFRLMLGNASAYLAYLRFLGKDFGPGSPGWWIRQMQKGLHRAIERDLLLALDGSRPSSPAREIHAELKRMKADQADDAVRDQLISLIVAGHDTVASALSWCLHGLMRRPDIVASLRQELDRHQTGPDLATIEKLPLLEAVCLEALRLVPTVEIVQRQAARDLEIGQFLIKKGELLSPCVYLVHQRPDLYDRPAEFRPERFLERQFAAHEFIPFGGGLRRCLGASLGLLEMKAVIATIVGNFDVQAPNYRDIRAKRRNVTIAPSRKFRAVFQPRAAATLAHVLRRGCR